MVLMSLPVANPSIPLTLDLCDTQLSRWRRQTASAQVHLLKRSRVITRVVCRMNFNEVADKGITCRDLFIQQDRRKGRRL